MAPAKTTSPRPRSPWPRRIRRILWRTGTYLLLILLAAAFLMPIFWSLTASVKSLGGVYKFPPEFWVSDPQWSNYGQALSKLPFFTFMGTRRNPHRSIAEQ